MEGIRRRSILRCSIPAALAGFAGCIDGATGTGDRTATDERSFDTPEPGECEQARRPEPTPTEEGLRPREYPSYPRTLEKDSAERFAEKYERAYQHNHFIAEEFIDGIDEITIGGGASRVVEDGGEYFVGVHGTINTADEKQPESTQTPPPTAAPSGSMPFAAWYYLTDRFALRNEVEADGMGFDEDDTPDLQGATVIVCN